MKQPTRLIKIDSIFNIRGNRCVFLARFSNTVHLDSQQNRNTSLLQRACECDRLGSTPAMAEDDDSGVRTIRAYQAQYVLERRGSGMITKHFYIDRGPITFAQTGSKFYLRVFGVVVPDETSNKPHHNHSPVTIDQALAAQAQGREANGGEEKQRHLSHASSMGAPANPCQANALLK
jgi:hypothetical protein